MSTGKPTTGTARRLTRVFVLVLAAAWTLDALPQDVPGKAPLRPIAVTILRPLGLETGPWSMFAPDPTVDNAWLTATRADTASPNNLSFAAAIPEPIWSSPQWADVPAWEKFYRFRHLNYSNRIRLPANRAAARDLARYLDRQYPAEDPEAVLQLTADGLRLVPPYDGGIPKPEEATWMLYSEPLATGVRP